MTTNRATFFYQLVFILALSWAPLGWAVADTVELPDGSKLDLGASCPVCNMKVSTGDLGPAAVVFKDGKVVGFDAAGDFFRYVLAPDKHGFDPGTIKNLYVTDRATKKFMEAKQAWYVLGSDVEGGMGLEAVPFSKKEDAEKFMADHKGKNVAAYSDVTLDALRSPKKLLKMKHDEGSGHKMKH